MSIIYLASCEYYRNQFVYKLGCTKHRTSRLSSFRTGCPPGMKESSLIEFVLAYETFATSNEQLKRYEDEIHNHFVQFRLFWNIPGDSEWFRFESSPIQAIQNYMESRGWKLAAMKDEAMVPRKAALQKCYSRNFKIINTQAERLSLLCKIQASEITKIVDFIHGAELAALVIAPCGFGKTRITVAATRDVNRLIICCPTRQIQLQWCDALDGACFCVGGKGSTDMSLIKPILEKPAFVIVSTYASCHLLKNATYDLLVNDEVHHMAGLVTANVGQTRQLLEAAVASKTKRLGLTYTPRNVDADTPHFSMDDGEVFGNEIVNVSFRQMVDLGLLPDYRIWLIRDEENVGCGVMARAACILQAWNAMEMVDKKTRFTLHHLLVYAANLDDAAAIETYFKAECSDLVLNLKSDNDTEAVIALFTAANRAILISVYKLGEGVDIPIANAVAFACVKQSLGQITQFTLRPGRWFEGKDVFHVIIPTLGEDMSGIETVLSALAKTDSVIRDEIKARSTGGGATRSFSTGVFDAMPQRIIMEGYESTSTEVCLSLTHVQRVRAEWIKVQEECLKNRIKTSVAYTEWRLPDYPDIPFVKSVTTWFKFLNPDKVTMELPDFARYVVENAFDDAKKYEAGRSASLPSIQEICDGYFGENNCDYNVIYGSVGRRR